MNEAKKSGPSATIWVAIIGAVALVIGALLFNSDWLAAHTDPAPVTTGSSDKPGPKLPGATSSGKGTFRSTGSNVPQSLSGKPMNEPLTTAKGKVVDAAGKGVADVKVRCTNCKTSIAIVLTDEEGNFKLPYNFEKRDDVQQMDIQVSKGDRSTTHAIPAGRIDGLVLQLK